MLTPSIVASSDQDLENLKRTLGESGIVVDSISQTVEITGPVGLPIPGKAEKKIKEVLEDLDQSIGEIAKEEDKTDQFLREVIVRNIKKRGTFLRQKPLLQLSNAYLNGSCCRRTK